MKTISQYQPSRIAQFLTWTADITAATTVGVIHGTITLVDSGAQTLIRPIGRVILDAGQSAKNGYRGARARFAAKRNVKVAESVVMPPVENVPLAHTAPPPPPMGFGDSGAAAA